MSTLDIFVVGVYLALVIGISWRIATRQSSGEDYFLAGRRMGGGILATSIMANQVSAVSLVGAPAFVALRPGGGLRWLQYELALPLAMLALLVVLLPLLRSVPGSSIYAYVEERFGRPMRRVLAGVFLVSRGLALGVILQASALVVASAFDWSLTTSVVIVGVFAVAYTSMGGIAADIWTDVVQLVILWGGTLACGVYVIVHQGLPVLEAIPRERAVALCGGWGLTGGSSFALAPMLIGGFFLYVSYYGCDQSQAQRLLTARSYAQAARAITLNGLLRFPLVLTYCLFGLVLAGLLQVDSGFAAAMASRPADSLVPVFLVRYLPDGLRGLLLAAILAAAMSSIDSALNSLAAVTLEDVAGLRPSRQSPWVGRLTSLGWGIFAIGAALVFARSGVGVLELINRVGSVFYGPLLAVFVTGGLVAAAGARHAMTGLVLGLAVNVALASFAPGVSWLWWNAAGFATGMVPGLWAARRTGIRVASGATRGQARLLVTAFVAMAAILIALTVWAGG